MSIYSIVSIYTFRTSEAADHALNNLWRHLSGGFEKSAGGEIWISQSCQDPALAAKICLAMGGALK